MALYELRQYTVQPGKMQQWLDFMEGTIIPFCVSKGMVVTASFKHETEESIYIWIRRFDDEAHRVKLYAAVYESDHWKNTLSPRVGELLDREKTVVNRIIPTRMSPLQ